MRIIHYSNRGQRYGNHIIQFAQWVAFAAEFPEYEVAYLPYWPLHGESAGTKDNPYCFFPFDKANPPRPGLRLRALHAVLSNPKRRRENMLIKDRLLTPIYGKRQRARLPEDVTSMASPEFRAKLNALGPVAWVRGHDYRDWGLVEKHQDVVRDYFKPPAEVFAEAERFVGPLRQQYDTIVGVFIRQSDYDRWHGGDFYFPTEAYVRFIRQLLERFGEGTGFVIASEAPQDPAQFNGLPIAFAPGQATGPRPYLVNVAVLSMCDYVASVPSGSGAIPAFFGNTPVIPLYAADQDLRTTEVLAGNLFDCVRHPMMSLSIH